MQAFTYFFLTLFWCQSGFDLYTSCYKYEKVTKVCTLLSFSDFHSLHDGPIWQERMVLGCHNANFLSFFFFLSVLLATMCKPLYNCNFLGEKFYVWNMGKKVIFNWLDHVIQYRCGTSCIWKLVFPKELNSRELKPW